MISLRTLGPLEVKVDGEDPPRKLTNKAIGLLIYIAFAHRHMRAKDHVMGTFWPDAEGPRGALATHTSLLRKEGTVGITDEGDQLRLDPSTVELDTTRFDQLERGKQWSEAAGMVGGLFLDGFTVKGTSGFDDWLEAQRASWRERCANVLIREAERLLKGGALEEAEQIADRARQLLPRSDAAVRAFMRGLALQGRKGETLDAGERFLKELARDPKREPELETLQLIDVIRKMKVPSQDTPRQKPRPPLIGRSSQLERALDVWEGCRAGEPGVVLVFGDEGMGKTRFAEEVMDRARLNNATVAIARGVPGDTNHQWIGLDTLAEGGLLGAPGIAGALPAAIAALGERSVRWGEAFPVKFTGDRLPPLQAMTEVVRAAAGEHPVLLVADDAQWMDGDSLQALIGLVRSLANSRVMIMVTASSDPERPEVNQLRSRIGHDLRGVSVTLEPLTQVDLVAMGKWALPSYDEDQVDRIARRMRVESGGYPLIAYVIYTAIADGMDMGEITQPWPRRKNTYRDDVPVDLDDHLVGAINVRMGRLSADAQAVLRVLAMLEGPNGTKRLSRGADLPVSSVERALDELEDRQWVVADARGYAFLARTIRDIVRKRHVKPGLAERITARMTGA